jgi:hypothetical protein
MSDKDILKDAKEAFKACDDAEKDNRALWLEDVKFARLGEQWPDKVKKQRETEGRPCLTINKLPSFIKQVTNDARQNKPAIKVHPVDDDASEEVAEILNGLIRNIEYSSDADVAYDTALESAVTGGFGYFRISTDYACDDVFDQDIKIERVVNPLNIYGDPESTQADSSDWNVSFVTEMLKEADFKKKYKNAAIQAFDADDNDTQWFDEDKIRIAEYWTRTEVLKKLLKLSDGTVMYEDAYLKMQDILNVMQIQVTGDRMAKSHKVQQRIITGAEVLEDNAWQGKYIPIVPVFGDEINVEGKRHLVSLIRGSKDAQQMFNYWRTASTELVALAPKAPFIGPKGAFNSDAEKWATANNKSHAYIEYDGQNPPQRQAFAGVPAGALQEALNASDDMKSIMGIYDASLGARSNETSGRAIMARQREGDVSTFNFVDNLSRAIRHAGRIIVDLIPHVYDAPRIIRIIHEDGSNESVKINQEHQAEAPNTDGSQNPQGMQQGAMGAEDQKEQQEFAEGIVKMYDVTVGKYDVTCEAGPSYTTKREEAAEQMMQLLQSFPAAAPIIGDLVAKNLDWPGADDIADRLKTMLPPQLQGANPAVAQAQQKMQMMETQGKQVIGQLQQQLQQAEQAAQSKQGDLQIKGQEVQLKQAELQIKQAELAVKQQELQIKQYEAETKRLEAESSAQAEQGRLQLDAFTAQTQQAPVQAPQEPKESQPINITIDGSRPVQKTAKATRQADGSYVMESIETPA